MSRTQNVISFRYIVALCFVSGFQFLPLLVWRWILWTLTFRQAVDFAYLHWISFRQVDFAYLLTLWVSICMRNSQTRLHLATEIPPLLFWIRHSAH